MKIRNVIFPGLSQLLSLVFLAAPSSAKGRPLADKRDFVDNKFTDGTYFSAICEREHDFIVPYVYSRYRRDNWLACWKIEALKEGQQNFPQQVFFLESLRSPLYIGLDF